MIWSSRSVRKVIERLLC